MKATGIVRRIDDLGRVVIPKEIRRTMRIREGDPLEIFTNGDGGVVFKKYSLMGGLGDFSAQLCESLYKTTGKMVTITDRDACISVAGGGRRELTDKNISPALAQIMEGRQNLPAPGRFSRPAGERLHRPLCGLHRRPHSLGRGCPGLCGLPL